MILKYLIGCLPASIIYYNKIIVDIIVLDNINIDILRLNYLYTAY